MKNLTKGALLTTVLAVGLGMTGCAGSNDAEPESPWGDCKVSGTEGEFTLDTLKPDELTVKADLPSTGWYNGDTVDDIKDGVDYCLLANIAYRSGLKKITLQNASFDGLIAGKAGDMDMTANQITITDERKEIFDFSEPYYDANSAVIAKPDADVTPENLRDLKLGVKQGTVDAIYVDQVLKPTNDPSVFPGDAELDAAVAAGNIDAAVQDLSVALGSAADSNGRLEVIGQIETNQQMGVLLPKGSKNTETVNKIITQMKEDGSLDEIISAYLGEAFGSDPTKVPVWDIQ